MQRTSFLHWCVCEHTKTFGGYSTALQRVNGPVVVFQRVHQLQDGANTADGAVDGGGANELRGQVCVEGQLDLQLHIYPQTDNAADLGRHTVTGWRETSRVPDFQYVQLCRRRVLCLVLIWISEVM